MTALHVAKGAGSTFPSACKISVRIILRHGPFVSGLSYRGPINFVFYLL